MSSHPAHPLYTIAQIRTIEHTAYAGLPSFTLMERAGQALADWLTLHLDHALITPDCPVLCLAGPGNNGGDALMAATLLQRQRPGQVQVWLTTPLQQLPDDAQQAWHLAQAAGVSIIQLNGSSTLPPCSTPPTWIVDGLFGIGLSRPINGIEAQLIAWAQQQRRHGARVLAIDVPSGLHADTGQVVGGAQAADACAMHADATLTMLGDKVGLHTGAGRDYAGAVSVANLGVDATAIATASIFLNQLSAFSADLPRRQHSDHKGTHGNLAVLGGASGMVGAPLLAGRAGLHAGAGRVLVGFLATDFPAIDMGQTELMLHAASALSFTQMQAIVLGCGLGESNSALGLLEQVLAVPCPIVLDADALNLLAHQPELLHRLQARAGLHPTVLTPHPLEAARLLGLTAAEVQANRIAATAQLVQRTGATVVLKGSGTLIQTAAQVVINATGSAALATAGTGDVLAGTLGALLAQGMPAHQAACAAVWLHGLAADRLVAAGSGPIGLTAGELPVAIRHALNHLPSLHA